MNYQPAEDDFVAAARRFCGFAEMTDRSGTEFLAELELELLDLYRLGIRLPWPDVEDVQFDDPLSEDDVAAVLARLADKLGTNRIYWEVFDPLDHEDHEPVCGDLYDDVGDIYKDIKRALLILDLDTAVSRSEALWQLKFGFDSHYGRPAISALRAVPSMLGRG